MQVLDDTACELGEGALWHPERRAFMWFDIIGQRLYQAGPNDRREWAMPELTSAAAWVDRDRLVLSSETGLWLFDLETGARERLAAIADDDPVTRSNDGRADRWGGFWVSTMGKAAEPGRGGIWRWHRGELRQVCAGLTIPNAICFDRDRGRAYYADTARHLVWSQPLDAEGWPEGERQVFLDLSAEGLHPDGAVIDAEGRFWVAQWGAGRVACHGPDGRFLRAVTVPARQPSCPAFGGEGLRDLYVTTARQGMDADARAADPRAGQTFVAAMDCAGVAEPRVALP